MDLSTIQSRPSSSSSSYIPPHRTQLHPRMHSFPSSSYSLFKSSTLFPFKEKWVILIASLLTIPFLFYLFTTAVNIHHSSKFTDVKPKMFGVVIDAGSTRSKINVFEFLNEEGMDRMVPFFGIDGSGPSSMKVNPGLMGFASDPGRAGSSILTLIEFAKQRVPKTEWKNTRIQLMGSVDLENVKSNLREGILESCRVVLRSSGFLFKDEWATLMKDQEEGLYTWVAANYALGNLGRDPQATTGIIELGGASMQIAFAQKDPAAMSHSKIIKLSGITYGLYIQSMPHFGQNPVWESMDKQDLSAPFESKDDIATNPCLPRGYKFMSNTSDTKLLVSHAVGNFSACKSKVMALLKRSQDECSRPPCELASSLLVESQSKLIPPDKFIYVSEIFGLVSKAYLSELETAGQHYCENDWNRLKMQHPDIDVLDLLRYCFSSAYIVALLHESLGISVFDRRIRFATQNGSLPLDWTLGAFIVQTMLEPLELESNDLGEIVGNDAVTYFSLFAVLFIIVLGAFFLLKWQKPQFKTIYDLEKGRYIVTRVPR